MTFVPLIQRKIEREREGGRGDIMWLAVHAAPYRCGCHICALKSLHIGNEPLSEAGGIIKRLETMSTKLKTPNKNFRRKTIFSWKNWDNCGYIFIYLFIYLFTLFIYLFIYLSLFFLHFRPNLISWSYQRGGYVNHVGGELSLNLQPMVPLIIREEVGATYW